MGLYIVPAKKPIIKCTRASVGVKPFLGVTGVKRGCVVGGHLGSALDKMG